MPIQILDRNHYGREIRRPSSPGWNPTTHLARMNFPGLGARNAWIKLDPQFNAFAGNEAIGWLLARALEIPAPAGAAFLIEDVAWFKKQLGDRYPSAAEGYPDAGELAAWCVTDMGVGSIRSVAPFDEWNLLAFLRTEEGAQIAAFDQWLGNTDRNNGNLLKLTGGRYAVIDHGILFCYEDWRKAPIAPTEDSHLWREAQNLQRDRKLTLKEFKQLQSGMAEFGLSHHRVSGICHPVIEAIISDLEGAPAAKNVLSCISERAAKDWIGRQVGVLI